MPKQTNQNLNSFLPVEMVPLVTSGWQSSSRYAGVFDPQGEALHSGYVSEDYKIVPNSSVVEAANDVLKKTGFDYEDHQILFDGKKFRQRFVLNELQGEVKPGDIVKIVIGVTAVLTKN